MDAKHQLENSTVLMIAETIRDKLHGLQLVTAGVVVEAWGVPLQHGVPVVPVFVKDKLVIVEVKEG